MRYAINRFQQQGEGVMLLYAASKYINPVELFKHVHGSYMSQGVQEVSEQEFFKKIPFLDERIKELSGFSGQFYI